MFRQINIKALNENAVSLFDDRWALVTAGGKDSYNTMTVSWGTLGELWGKDVCTVFIRPQRHTLGFVENNEYFTLSVFGEEYRKALTFCGSKSGRDYDKAKETGLTPKDMDGVTAFEEAEIIIKCRKLYADSFKKENFIDGETDRSVYAAGDYHRFFVGEIVGVYVKA